jgi:hypothetical protein
MTHPQDRRETPPPVSPIWPWFGFLKLILFFHELFSLKGLQSLENTCYQSVSRGFVPLEMDENY